MTALQRLTHAPVCSARLALAQAGLPLQVLESASMQTWGAP